MNEMDWWDQQLSEYEQMGRDDADKGVFDWPYDDNSDPTDEVINLAYKRGFDARRTELGPDKFKWSY